MLIEEEDRNMSLISGIFDKNNIEATLAQCDDFEQWLVADMWNKYKEYRMNQRTIIENEIKDLGIKLPNGTVKKDYDFSFQLPLDKVSYLWIKGLEELGLQCERDDDKFHITGVPVKAGDFTLQLGFNPIDSIDGEAPSILEIPIAFNPDPRSLWKNIATPRDIPFFKEDYVSEYVEVKAGEDGLPRKDMVAASQRGRSHAQEGKPRDDHFKLYHNDDNDWYIIAVADGAGSAKFSRKGSEIACETVVKYCAEKLEHYQDLEELIRTFYATNNDSEIIAEDSKNVENVKSVEVVENDNSTENVKNDEIIVFTMEDSGTTEIAENAVNHETMEKIEDARKRLGDAIYQIICNAAFTAHKAINEAAKANEKELSATPKDFATTLLFAICKKFDFGWFVASFWVGDGAMCLYNEEKKTAKLLGAPDEGEYSGQTRFLTMPEIFNDSASLYRRLRFSIEDDFTALMLMTDGVSDPMFETEKNLNDYNKWNEFWEKLHIGFPEDEIPGVDLSDDNSESQNQLLHWLDFWAQGNHDDRTIAILY